MTTLPTRQQVDRAAPLEFPKERNDISICIEVAPDGLHVRCDYTGSLSSIPAAIEKLRAAGILDLVKPAAAAPAEKKSTKVQPRYNADGDPCCPVHGRELTEGQYGYFCSAKAKAGEVADKKGYCGIKFEV